MTICDKIKIKKSKICTGDMDNLIILQNRTILPPEFGEIDPVIVFTTLLDPWAAIKTISPTARFDNINIEDTPTHEIYIFYDASIWPLDSNNVFILLEDSRRLRIVGVTDMNEMKETIRILATERGVDTLAGSEA